MSDWFTPEEWEHYNKIGMKGLKADSRFKNRFNIVNAICSISAIIISICALIVSIISLLQ